MPEYTSSKLLIPYYIRFKYVSLATDIVIGKSSIDRL